MNKTSNHDSLVREFGPPNEHRMEIVQECMDKYDDLLNALAKEDENELDVD